jgi:hypothetical protein
MKRVPASLVLLVLHREADARGDEQYRVAASTLRSWVRRGHITRGDGGYDLAEILAYFERRATAGRDQSAGQVARRSEHVQR